MEIDSREDTGCPLCTSLAFKPTGQKFNLADILTRWQSEAGITLRESVWDQYTRPIPHEVILYRCNMCGFARFEPPLAGSREFYADITEKEYYVPRKWEFYQAIKDIKRRKCRRILDVGCGSGEFLNLLRRRTKDVESAGYEFSLELAYSARSQGHIVYYGPFPQAVLKGDRNALFDAACVFQVIEHVVDPASLIRDIGKLLKPKGLLIVSVPNANGPLRFFSDALTDIPPHHVSRWCSSAFRIGMPKLGFKLEKVVYEPLPDYLWDGYLPAMWDSNIWPAVICRFFDNFKRMEKKYWIFLFIKMMRSLRIKWLWGVPGHTLYTLLEFVKR